MLRLYSSLIILSFIWGASFLFNELLLETLNPFGIVFGRSLFGFIFLLIYGLLKKEIIFSKKLPYHLFILVALINNTIPWMLIPFSQAFISTGLASIVNALTPLMTIIVGILFFQTKMLKKQLLGVVLGLSGILFLVDIQSIFSGDNQYIGALLVMIATIMYGTSNHISKRNLSNVTVLQLSLNTMFFTSCFSFVPTIISGQEISVIFASSNMLIFVGLGIFGSGVAYLLYYFMVKEGSPEFASLVTYLVPISAIFWGVIILEEKITLSMIMGLIIVFLGVYVSSSAKKVNSKIERDVA